MLVPFDVVELIELVVLPVLFVELVTLDEFEELTELDTLVELLWLIEPVASADTTLSAEPHAHSPSANTVTRCLMVSAPMLSRGIDA